MGKLFLLGLAELDRPEFENVQVVLLTDLQHSGQTVGNNLVIGIHIPDVPALSDGTARVAGSAELFVLLVLDQTEVRETFHVLQDDVPGMVRTAVIHADHLRIGERDILIEDRIETLGDEPLDVVEGYDDGKAQSHKL